MTRILLACLAFLFVTFPLVAQKSKESNRAVATLTSYDAQGKMLCSTQAFFCSPTGEVWAPYAALLGAVRAEVVDAQGRTAQVQRVVQASSVHDVVKLTTNIPTKKLFFLPIAKDIQPEAWLQTYYTVNKKELPQPVNVLKQESLDSLSYYTISTPNEARYMGAPVVNERGEVVALTQKNVQKNAATACALDARILLALSSTASTTQAFNRDLRALHIAPLLVADNEEQAYTSVFLSLLSPADTIVASTLINDFMRLYPHSTELYVPAANFHAMKRGDWSTAYDYIQKGLSKEGEHRAKLYIALSDLMKQKAESDTLTAPRWTLDDALAAANKAYALRPDTTTARQQAVLLYQLKRWAEAREKWKLVNASSLAQWDSYLLEASCVENLKGDSLEVLSLVDAAVLHYERTKVGSPQVYLTRANYLLKAGLYRRAVADLIAFEKQLPTGQLPNAAFYAERSSIEVKAKMYQQALDDLETAISRAVSQEERTMYLTDKAYLQLQVSLFAEAATTAQSLLALDANNADAYKILGLSWGERKQKSKALQFLRRAQALGDAQAETLIAKYSK
ncbi:MAG: hypothetical protein Q4D66_04915 [Bacteroidales bacterium]|nr:hypothetical protein [Bacteroidales bacterium]